MSLALVDADWLHRVVQVTAVLYHIADGARLFWILHNALW